MNLHNHFLFFSRIPFSLTVFHVAFADAAQTVYQAVIQDNISGPCQAAYQEQVTKVVLVEPVYINTFVSENTTFRVNDGLTVTVDNAPTSFDTVTYGTTTLLSPNSASL